MWWAESGPEAVAPGVARVGGPAGRRVVGLSGWGAASCVRRWLGTADQAVASRSGARVAGVAVGEFQPEQPRGSSHGAVFSESGRRPGKR